MAQLSLVIVSARARLREVFEETGHVEVQVVLPEAAGLLGALRRHRPDALYVDLGTDPEGTLELLERLPAPRPILLLAGPQEDSSLILRAMRLGAREFFSPVPAPETVRAAVQRLLLDPGGRSVAAVRKLGPVVAVMGAKGGVGATFTACQLAAELERSGAHVVLVDMNLRVGDVALFLDVHPRYTLANLATEHDQIDSAYLHTILEPHRSGVRVLASPSRPEEADLVRVAHLEKALGVLREEFDWVVLDVPRSWDETSLRALDLADQILLVTLMDVPTLNHARQHLDLLQRLGHPLEKIRLVANRYSGSGPLTRKDVEDFLGRVPDALIPNDYPTALACVNEGKSVWESAPRTPLFAGFAQLAKHAYAWCNVAPPAERPRSWGFGKRLGKLLRRSRHAAD